MLCIDSCFIYFMKCNLCAKSLQLCNPVDHDTIQAKILGGYISSSKVSHCTGGSFYGTLGKPYIYVYACVCVLSHFSRVQLLSHPMSAHQKQAKTTGNWLRLYNQFFPTRRVKLVFSYGAECAAAKQKVKSVSVSEP